MRLMRLWETTGDSCDSYRQLWTHENQKDHLCHETHDNHRLMGTHDLRETIGDSCDSAKLMETHENKGDKWRLLRLRETTGY